MKRATYALLLGAAMLTCALGLSIYNQYILRTRITEFALINKELKDQKINSIITRTHCRLGRVKIDELADKVQDLRVQYELLKDNLQDSDTSKGVVFDNAEEIAALNVKLSWFEDELNQTATQQRVTKLIILLDQLTDEVTGLADFMDAEFKVQSAPTSTQTTMTGIDEYDLETAFCTMAGMLQQLGGNVVEITAYMLDLRQHPNNCQKKSK